MLEREKLSRAELEKSNIELKVENKFLLDDLASSKKRLANSEKKYEELHSQVLAVTFHSKIYNSKKVKVTAI
jgi:hypothetical protein